MMTAAPERVVEVPYAPRRYQRVVGHLARTHRFVVLVCHRRWGKTVLGVNLLQQTALQCEKERPRCGFIAPTYTQGKSTAFDYMQYYARPIPSMTVNQSELRVDFPLNGGQTRIFGADHPDSLRGLYFDRVVLDEFAMHPSKTFSEVVGPTLVDRGGSALFMGTPNGKNAFWDIAEHAKARVSAGDTEWAYSAYKASETGLLAASYLAQAKSMMTEDEYQQEFECSFTSSVKGSIYRKEMAAAHEAGRITQVPYDPSLPVATYWDLGIGDAMAVWFVQSLRSGEIRLIDYYEASGEGFPHYAAVLRERGYLYGTHWAPHDIAVRELGTGRSRQEVAKSLGIDFALLPRLQAAKAGEVEEGIHAVRMLLPRCWFDATKCKVGLDALQNYRRDYNQRLDQFTATPVHDWASHGADAFRGLAVQHTIAVDTSTSSLLKPKPVHVGPNAFMGM